MALRSRSTARHPNVAACSGRKMKRARSRNWLICSFLLAVGLLGFIRVAQESTEQIGEQSFSEAIKQIHLGANLAIVSDAVFLEALTSDAICVKNLEVLYLEPHGSLNRRYAQLKLLSSVSVVHCSYFRAEAEALQFLKAMPSLEDLSFTLMHISDESVKQLAEFKTLKRISFSGLDVSRTALNALKAERPDLIISVNKCTYRE